jgi:hypothetical protein
VNAAILTQACKNMGKPVDERYRKSDNSSWKRAQHPPSHELETCVKPFLITARTATARLTFTTFAHSSSDAVILTAELLGDQPCSISVKAGAR